MSVLFRKHTETSEAANGSLPKILQTETRSKKPENDLHSNFQSLRNVWTSPVEIWLPSGAPCSGLSADRIPRWDVKIAPDSEPIAPGKMKATLGFFIFHARSNQTASYSKGSYTVHNVRFKCPPASSPFKSPRSGTSPWRSKEKGTQKHRTTLTSTCTITAVSNSSSS